MTRITTFLILLIVLTAGTAVAGMPLATPAEGVPGGDHPAAPAGNTKALGDPTDFQASFIAGAEYLRTMQADVTEDNAGNGFADTDPDDGGWDWETTAFEHSTSASPMNIYGATARGLLEAYLLDPRAEWFTALKDAADQMIAIGPDPGVRSAGDVVYLLKFAALPTCPDAAFYRAGAQTIWTRHITVYGDMVSLAVVIRDGRGASYPNGIIPWDISAWVEAAMLMNAAYPAGGHVAEAVAMAEILYDDSLDGTPTYFDVYGRCQGYTTDYSNVDYWWYSLGVSGLIRAFATAGVHLDELPTLEATLLACQYPDGAFSNQYGAPTDMNDRDWQSAGYAAMAIYENLTPTATTMDALYRTAKWLAETQDVTSGGWVYDDGTHLPEVGGEAAAAVAMGWSAAGTQVSAAPTDDPINCGEDNTVTFSYTPGPATPALRGYDVTFRVTGPVSFGLSNIGDLGSLAAIGTHAFYAVDNGDGTWTVSDALLGGSVGLEAAADLFDLDLTTLAEGAVTVEIVAYRLRDLDNVDIFADVADAGYTIDCTAPPAVTDITASPGHNKVVVDWAMADESDVAVYEVWRGMWYDTNPNTSAYPEYDDLSGDVIPTRPTDRADALASAEWVPAGTVPVGTLTFTDIGVPTRGVYYYEVFAVDAAVNHGPVAAANDRATSYWLGDVLTPYDGLVDSGDITQLGANFGLGDGDGYNNEIDVGPTDDNSGLGIPLTDSVVDFEDLMIFALNYGNVGPAKLLPQVYGEPALAWTQIDETTWSLDLTAPCTGLKGVHLRVALPADVRAVVTGGELLTRQDDQVFFANVGGLDANVAVLGTGRGFSGHGQVLQVELSAPADLGTVALDARALDNSRFTNAVGTAPSARNFAVRPAFPNPFNPMTTIAFDLPVAAFVSLDIYAIDGRRVRTLLREERIAGPHAVQWDGRDDAGGRLASGTYLFNVKAGGWEATRKMQLVK